MHEFVTQRRHLAVLFWTQALQPRLARMNDEGVASCGGDGGDEAVKVVITVELIDADARLYRDGQRHRRAHRRDAFGFFVWFGFVFGFVVVGLFVVSGFVVVVFVFVVSVV